MRDAHAYIQEKRHFFGAAVVDAVTNAGSETGGRDSGILWLPVPMQLGSVIRNFNKIAVIDACKACQIEYTPAFDLLLRKALWPSKKVLQVFSLLSTRQLVWPPRRLLIPSAFRISIAAIVIFSGCHSPAPVLLNRVFRKSRVMQAGAS